MTLNDIVNMFEVISHEVPAYQFLLVFLLFVLAPKLLDKLLSYSRLAQAKKLLGFVKEIDSVHFEDAEEKEVLQTLKQEILNKLSSESSLNHAVREVKNFTATFPVTSIYFISLLLAFIQAVFKGSLSFEMNWTMLLVLTLAAIVLIIFDIVLQKIMDWIDSKVRALINKHIDKRHLQDVRKNVEENRNALQGMVESIKNQIISAGNQVLINRRSAGRLLEVKSALETTEMSDDIKFELIEIKARAESQAGQFEVIAFELGNQMERCEKLVDLNKDLPESSCFLYDLFHVKELFRELKRLVGVNNELAEIIIDDVDSLLGIENKSA